MRCKGSVRYFDFDRFADHLLDEIAVTGLTLTDVAEDTGLTLDILTKLRARQRNLSVDALVTLAAWAGLKVSDYVRTREEVLA